jgi:threonine dehydrogenase-like Zn-dependent dehydrogenase
VTVLGHHHEKLEVARSVGLDAHHADMFRDDEGRFDVVVDVTGRPAGLSRALELVHPRGTVVLKSTFHGEAPLPSWPIVVNEVTIVGSRCGPFGRAIELLAAGTVKVEPLVSAVLPFEDFGEAFARARRELKIIFTNG